MKSRTIKQLQSLRGILICSLALGCVACSGSDAASKLKTLVASPTIPEIELYESAKRAYDQGLYTVSRETWTSLLEGYPGSYFATLAELKIADAYFYAADFPNALSSYEEFARAHPGHEATPYVRFQIANTNFAQYNGVKFDQSPLFLSIKGYKQLVETYPQSEFAPLARRKIDHCRELLAEHEAYVASFYAKQGQIEASAKRLADLELQYPDSRTANKNFDEAAAEYPTFEQVKLEAKNDIIKQRAAVPNAKKPLVKPVTPQLILATDLARQGLKNTGLPVAAFFESGARASAVPATPVLEAAEFVHSRTVKSAPTSRQVLTALHCEQIGDYPSFTATFSTPVQIGMREDEDARRVKIIVNVKNDEEAAELQGSFENQSCEVDSLSTEVRPVPGSANRRFEIALTLPLNSSATFFTLDRPYRIVGVAKPRTNGAL